MKYTTQQFWQEMSVDGKALQQWGWWWW